MVCMHRPTHEPWREEAGEYPSASHLAGRKRLWEFRAQLRFKEAPAGRAYFALTLAKHMQKPQLVQAIERAMIKACQKVVGGDFYQSAGDDPARAPPNKAEPPTLAMPLWAFDQFVVSEPGEEPSISGNFEGLGMKRTDGTAAYTKAVDSLVENFSTDKVYTFLFWGLSRFLDLNHWEIRGGGFLPGLRMNASVLFGKAPLMVSMYELLDNEEAINDRRHLLSKRRHCFNLALWSQLQPPEPESLEQLLGRPVKSERPPVKMEPESEGQCFVFCRRMLCGKGPRPSGGGPKGGTRRSLQGCWALC